MHVTYASLFGMEAVKGHSMPCGYVRNQANPIIYIISRNLFKGRYINRHGNFLYDMNPES